jgi:hypothetical protein
VLALADEPRWGNGNWKGAGVFLLTGSGAGHSRRIAAHGGKQVTLEQPFAVAPDATSLAGITPLQENYLLRKNSFRDVQQPLIGDGLGKVIVEP